MKEPKCRIGYEDISELKDHPYFANIDWATLHSSAVPYNPNRRPIRGFKTQQEKLERLRVSNSFSNAIHEQSPLIQNQSPAQSPMGSPHKGSNINHLAHFGSIAEDASPASGEETKDISSQLETKLASFQIKPEYVNENRVSK